jgi:hypothetical protein
MSYTLNFSRKLKKDGTEVIYDPEGFDDQPIRISVPDVVKLFEEFIKNFEKAGLVEQSSQKDVQSDETKIYENVKSSNAVAGETKSPATATGALKALSGEVYYCQVKKINTEALTQLVTGLTEYMKKSFFKMTPENFLSEDTHVLVSGIKEVLEVRNYLVRYTQSDKKYIQNGYLYVMRL